MGKKWMRFLTYCLTALAASAITLTLVNHFPSYRTGGGTKLDRLEKVIQTYFIGEADLTAAEDAAASSMVDALGDRWSHYISADEYESYQNQMNNAYVGVGITVALRDDGQGIAIRQVTKGGPAEEAGIQAGDILTAVNGESVRQADLRAVRKLVVGEENTQVELTVDRDGTEKVFQVTRRSFETRVAEGKMLSNQIGYVVISNFNSRCAEESIAAIEELRSQGAVSFIFDVRNNPGGYKDELVKLLDYLLPEGLLFRSEDYTGKIQEDFSDAACLDMPMVVLVNGESYSAAEFFAAALREYEAAQVVGQQTCGKGYYQITLPLGDGSAVALSVGKYYTPKCVSLANVGITPDQVVEVDEDTFQAIYTGALPVEEDPQIRAAVALLGQSRPA